MHTQYPANTLIEWYDPHVAETLSGAITGYVRNGESRLPGMLTTSLYSHYIIKDAVGEEYTVSLANMSVKPIVNIPGTHFMSHEERVNFIFDTIETQDDPNFTLHFLILSCGSKEEWDFEEDTISFLDANRIHVRKTGLFIQALVERFGCEKARKIMSDPSGNRFSNRPP